MRIDKTEKKHHVFAFCVLLLFYILFFLDNTFAQAPSPFIELTTEEKAWITNNPTVIYGAEKDWAPFDFVNAQGQHTGLSKDYLDIISEITGLRFEARIDEWSELLELAKNQDIDFLPSIHYRPERTEYLYFSDPYQYFLEYFFISDDLVAETLDDLKNKTVAIPKAYANIDYVKESFPDLEILVTEDLNSAIHSVIEKEADVLLDSYAVITYALKQGNISGIRAFKPRPGMHRNIHMAATKSKSQLISILNKAMQAIPDSQIESIQQKWLGFRPQSIAQKTKLNIDEQAWLNANRKIRIGILDNWPPYEYANENGVLQGYTYDIYEYIKNDLGIEFEYISDKSWPELLQAMRDNELDVLGSLAQFAERDEYMKFTDAYYYPPVAIFSLSNKNSVQNISALKDKTLAIEKEYYVHNYLRKNYPEIKVLTFDSTADALKAVAYGEADVYVGDQGAANWVVKENALTNLMVLPENDIGTIPLRLGVRDDWQIFTNILNKSLNNIPDPELNNYRQKWFGLDAVGNRIELTQDEKTWLQDNNNFNFVGDPNWLPYEAFDEQGNYIGIVAEHLALIEKRLGINIKIVKTNTWNESLEKIASGEVDIISEADDAEIDGVEFTSAYISSPIVIVMDKDQNYVEGLAQILDKKIATVEDYGHAEDIVKMYPQANIVSVASIQDGLTAVSTGQVDAFVATLAQNSYHISRMGMNNIKIVGKTEFTTNLAFGVREEHARLIPLLDRALSSITLNERQFIDSRWSEQKFAERIDYSLAIKLAALFLGLSLLFIYWITKLRKEIALRKELETQTKTLLDNIPLQVIVTSLNGKFLEANPKALKDYSLSEKDLNQYHMSDFFSERKDAEVLTEQLLKQGKVEGAILPFKKFDGEIRSMMISVLPIYYKKQNAYLTIAIDMTERLYMEAALLEAKNEADSANQAKSEFLANMSHEIRTPMNAIIGFTELLNDQVKKPKLRSFVSTIQSAGNTLLDLINDILDLSKIEAGKLKIDKAPVNSHTFFKDVSNIFSLRVQKKNLDFILNVDPALPESLILDSTRLRQVLFNLIGNAVKFTHQGHIIVSVHAENINFERNQLNLIISVEDTGIGIAKKEQKAIFEEFVQSKGQDTGRYGGTGLGLSISQRLARMMGGDLLLKSEQGKGSKFTVRLQAIEMASVLVEGNDSVQKDYTKIVFDPARILIVDDVQDNLDLLLANFERSGLSVTQAHNGLEALNLEKDHEFDLILLDIRMPVMNGYVAAEEIKAFSEVPIIALTASVMTDQFDRLKSDNFSGYLRKPILKSQLFAEIAKFLPHSDAEEYKTTDSEVYELSQAEKFVLPQALADLQEIKSEFADIAESNNMETIKSFSSQLKKLAKESPIRVVTEYQKKLAENVNSFDIAEIKKSLQEFSELYEGLEKLRT